jgi:hypothetical protein
MYQRRPRVPYASQYLWLGTTEVRDMAVMDIFSTPLARMLAGTEVMATAP